MNTLMTHPHGPKSNGFFVNDPHKMPHYLRNFEYCRTERFYFKIFL